MKINKIRLFVILLLIAVITSSCDKSEQPAEQIVIHLQVPFDSWAPMYDTDVPTSPLGIIYQDAAANYHKLNPHITVIIDYDPDFMYNYKTNYHRVGLPWVLDYNSPPDIVPVQMDRDSWAKDKLWDLLQLDKTSPSAEIDIDQQALQSGMVDGKLLTLPYAEYPQAMLYNKAMFDAAHIAYPKNDWTWEQFRAISKKFKGSSAPIIDYGIPMLEVLLAGKGQRLKSPSGDTFVGYMDSPESISVVQWRNAYYRDVLTTSYIEAVYVPYVNFDNSSAPMLVSSYGNEFPNFQGSNKAKIGVVPMPHFEGGERASFVYYNGFGIPLKSKHPEAAWEFIKYLTTIKNEDSIKFADHILTTSRSMAEASGQSKNPNKSIFLNEMNYALQPSLYDENLIWQLHTFGASISPVYDLVYTADKDIPTTIHKLAAGVTQEMKRLKQVEDEKVESSPQ